VSLIPKMVRRGDLTPRDARPSLSHAEVLEVAAARKRAAAERAQRGAEPRTAGPRPPDDEHEWLLGSTAAAVLGCSEGALGMRANRGQVPFAVHDRRRWYRLDLLELQVRAQVARQRGQVNHALPAPMSPSCG
jgi:hypothetical protein